MEPARRAALRRRSYLCCWYCGGYFNVGGSARARHIPAHLLRDAMCPRTSRRLPRCARCEVDLRQINARFTRYQDWYNFWSSDRRMGCHYFKGRPGTRHRHPMRIRYPFGCKCHFCGEPVGPADKKRRPYNIHHVYPRRRFKDKAQANAKGNRAPAHDECHVAFNKFHDRNAPGEDKFEEVWAGGPLPLAKNIFNERYWLA